ncbi:hypothetical protein CCHOA_05275 [Corynebacterium choanae]|uniref:Uncharacterized protein n=1 Tax=Corynebacterium choanae TaxID=1862358 RepID=A0A3G6J693_9CORY|nr:hypothetical protein CCHOA_05275 [Corynebacterium choanae]
MCNAPLQRIAQTLYHVESESNHQFSVHFWRVLVQGFPVLALLDFSVSRLVNAWKCIAAVETVDCVR